MRYYSQVRGVKHKAPGPELAQQRLQMSPTRNFGKHEQPCYETCCILSPVDVKKSFLLAEVVSYMQAGGGHLYSCQSAILLCENLWSQRNGVRVSPRHLWSSCIRTLSLLIALSFLLFILSCSFHQVPPCHYFFFSVCLIKTHNCFQCISCGSEFEGWKAGANQIKERVRKGTWL